MFKNTLIVAFLMILSFQVSAIQVNVKSPSKGIIGIGFSVNGKNYGGLGSSYSKSDAPIGNYTFGVRSGRDIACKMANGEKTITLRQNTTAILKYNGRECKALIAAK